MAEIKTKTHVGQLKVARDKALLPEATVLLSWLRQMLLIREFEVRTMLA